MNTIASTIQKIVNQRKTLIKKGLSKKNQQYCEKTIKYFQQYLDAYGKKWSICAWQKLCAKNFKDIEYITPTNKAGLGLLNKLEILIDMKKFKILLIGKMDLKGEIAKYDHPTVQEIHGMSIDMNENLKLIHNANLIICTVEQDFCETSDKVLKIARLADKEIIHHSIFERHASTINN